MLQASRVCIIMIIVRAFLKRSLSWYFASNIPNAWTFADFLTLSSSPSNSSPFLVDAAPSGNLSNLAKYQISQFQILSSNDDNRVPANRLDAMTDLGAWIEDEKDSFAALRSPNYGAVEATLRT